MAPLNHYLVDGANKQARAVLCLLQGFDVEESWSKEFKRYTAEPMIARWQNCREQGYVITMRTPGKTLNVAFFEHRNSDDICALRWVQTSTNSPTIETAQFGGACYAGKFDVSHRVGCGKIVEMAEWIEAQLTAFWSEQKAARAAIAKATEPAK